MIIHSNLKWHLSTNEQLWSIVKHDPFCPPSLLKGAVEEMLNRNLWDNLILYCLRRQVKDLRLTSQVFKIDEEDFLQVGRMAVFKSVGLFKPKKGLAFNNFIFLKVKSELWKFITVAQSQKRDARKVISYNVKVKEDTEFEYFLPDKVNVESYVVAKVTLEQLLKRVNKHQRKVMQLTLEGYSFVEIADILGRGSGPTMWQAYNLGVKKLKGIVGKGA